MSGDLQVIQRRAGLPRTRHCLQDGALTIGFLGGSITDPAEPYKWPEPVIAWFINTYPQVRLSVENAAIGATGSELAAFRTQRDILDHDCDLVFVEYAANDDPVSDRTLRSREGVLRQLLADGGRDVVLVYTFAQPMYAAMHAGEVPASIVQFETLAEHYQVPSVWMGLHALRQVERGYLRWEEWLPDGLHPHERGSLSYGEAVIAYLARELGETPSPGRAPLGDARPNPMDAGHWEGAAIVPWGQVTTQGPWALRRWPRWANRQVLTTAAPGATLQVTFRGTGIVLATLFGSTAAEVRWRIDDGLWQTTMRERPAWAGELGWFRLDVLDDALAAGAHICQIEVVHGDRPDCAGTTAAVVFIGVLP